MLFVRSNSDIRTIADLVAQAKANPNKFNYSHPGVGTKSHLTAELLKLRAGIEMVAVPYRGGGPTVQAVMEGTVQIGSVALAGAESLIQSGELRALAVTSEKRWFSMPNVPTMIEAGYKDFVSDTFNAILAPARVPQPIIDAAGEGKPRRLPAPRRARSCRASRALKWSLGSPEELTARIKAEIAGCASSSPAPASSAQ